MVDRQVLCTLNGLDILQPSPASFVCAMHIPRGFIQPQYHSSTNDVTLNFLFHEQLLLFFLVGNKGYKVGLQPETLADGDWLVKQNQPVSKIETKSDTKGVWVGGWVHTI